MAGNTKIEWTDQTWNPVTGCSEVSPGCDHCYAKTFAERWRGVPGHPFERGFDVVMRPERLEQPVSWRKPRRVFVNSMSDLFHDAIPDEYIADVFAVMAGTPKHTYQVLTKRHGRMRSLLNAWEFRQAVYDRAWNYDADGRFDPFRYADQEMTPAHYASSVEHRDDDSDWWPLPNVWLGVSVEDQKRADLRIPALLETPAAVRFLSCEPLLGPVDLLGPVVPRRGRPRLTYWLDGRPGWGPEQATETGLIVQEPTIGTRIDWVIVGGESGPGARPMHIDWARRLRDQCAAAGVPYFFKQHGEYLCAVLEDAPQFSGGRAFRHPRGGTSAAVIRHPGPSGTYRNQVVKPMKPGDRTKGLAMLDDNTIAVRVGKNNAGRLLDGRTHDEFPEAIHA